MSKILIALGGNALGNSPSKQLEAVKNTAKTIIDLFKQGHKIVIVHGNGPQIGTINNALMAGFKAKEIKEVFPFAECGAMSQGYIGYHIQNAINNELSKNELTGNVVTLITQTIIAKNDQAFANPSKPIGGFMTETEAKLLASHNEWIVKEDAGRGWRRVIASPKPVDIKEKAIVKVLLDDNIIVIAGGGGGVPVYKLGPKLIGIDAVIDKDLTAAKLAEEIEADSLVILTAVDNVKINFGKKTEEALQTVSIKELQLHIKDKQFAPGSMLPKVEAAIEYVKSTHRNAYIGALKNAAKIIAGNSGTKIIE